MSASNGRSSLWWDRELDNAGKPLRPDVRASAHEVWNQACARVQSVLGDSSDAAPLMEKSVSQVSRYLDRIGSAPYARDPAGLVMFTFCRTLRRYAMKDVAPGSDAKGSRRRKDVRAGILPWLEMDCGERTFTGIARAPY